MFCFYEIIADAQAEALTPSMGFLLTLADYHDLEGPWARARNH